MSACVVRIVRFRERRRPIWELILKRSRSVQQPAVPSPPQPSTADHLALLTARALVIPDCPAADRSADSEVLGREPRPQRYACTSPEPRKQGRAGKQGRKHTIHILPAESVLSAAVSRPAVPMQRRTITLVRRSHGPFEYRQHDKTGRVDGRSDVRRLHHRGLSDDHVVLVSEGTNTVPHPAWASGRCRRHHWPASIAPGFPGVGAHGAPVWLRAYLCAVLYGLKFYCPVPAR